MPEIALIILISQFKWLQKYKKCINFKHVLSKKTMYKPYTFICTNDTLIN